MSGGSLNYFYVHLEDHVNDFGDKELNELVSDLVGLFKAREWFLSSDTCEGDWNEARDAFKEKWFTQHGRQERIKKYLDEICEEVRKSFGISNRFCWTCSNWEIKDGLYGKCSFINGCLMHRSESCEKWEGKN